MERFLDLLSVLTYYSQLVYDKKVVKESLVAVPVSFLRGLYYEPFSCEAAVH